MNETLGGGTLIGVFAALWVIYFLPQWIRRRQFHATEQNALRLQRTYRVLAESAEQPVEVRAETAARDAAAQERVLRSARAAEAARRRREVAAARAQAARERRAAHRAQAIALAEQARAAAVTSAPGALQIARSGAARRRAARLEAQEIRRRRRVRARITRLVVAFTLLAGLVVTGWGVALLLAGGAATVFFGGLAWSACAALIVRAIAPKPTAAVPPVVQPVQNFSIVDAVAEAAAPPQPQHPALDRSWTPVPLPKPLHQLRHDAMVAALAEAEAADRARREELMAQQAAQLPNLSERLRTGAVRAPRVGGGVGGGVVGGGAPAAESGGSRGGAAAGFVDATTGVHAAGRADAERLRAMGVIDIDSLEEPEEFIRTRRTAG